MSPWIPVAAASIVAALAFFFAGYFARGTAKNGPLEEHVPQDLDVREMLAQLIRTTEGAAAAILDRDGLVVEGVGLASEDATALASTVAAALLDARRYGLADLPAAVELDDRDGRRVRFRVVALGDEVFIVATLGILASPSSALESEIEAAIPRLLRAA